MVAGTAARFSFGNNRNSLQNVYGGRLQLQAYHGIEIVGSRKSGTPILFEPQIDGDPSLNVIGTIDTEVLVVTASPGQSVNIQEWRNSGGTALASVNSTGNITTSGSITSSGSSGIGYAADAGGTITQSTSKSTAVTIDKISGQITTDNALLGGYDRVTFTVSNSTVSSTDVVILSISGGAGARTHMVLSSDISDNSFDITIMNLTAGDRSQSLDINFAIIRAVIN